MDEAKLKKLLENIDVPPADENARKRAVNMAVSEFKTHQKEKQKTAQGSSLLSRLTGKTNPNRRDPMETKSRNKLIYGGMATAMAVVLIAGVSVTQLSNFESARMGGGYDELASAASSTASTDAAVQFNVADAEQASGGKALSALSASPKPDTESAASGGQVLGDISTANSAMPPEAVDPAKTSMNKEVFLTMAEEKGKDGLAKTRQDLRANGLAGRVEELGQMIAPASQPVIIDSDAKRQEAYYHDVGRDKFSDFEVNPFKAVSAEPVSTFSTDVDTASYSFMRSQINNGVLPQKDAVRIEEMVNYFDYNYPLPESREQPFKPTVTIVDSPWAAGKKLMHIGIKGFDVQGEQPRSNLVFLLDTSGSMNEPNKLPLVINSLKMLLETLRPDDTVAIAVYAGSAGTVLEPTKISDKGKIIAALENLSAGGGTAGAEGINLAYQLAEQNFDSEAVNRVILATDGDFNVGITNPEELQDFVERKRDKGIFLSVLGFGQGNYNDQTMQTLAQNGNGVAAYIDTLNEARKVLVDEATSTLFPIAKDVKIQVEFNPAVVAEYRLIGYETRALNREDFNNDAVDAGDIGAGHTVTAIYEITPVGGPTTVDNLRYDQSDDPLVQKRAISPQETAGEYAFVKIRYKLPNEDVSKLITTPVTAANRQLLFCAAHEQCKPGNYASADTVWATAVAGFGQILQGGKYTGNFNYDDVIALAQGSKGSDEFGQRAEFINLVRLAKSSSPQ